MSWLILNLGCECQTIVVSFKNGALIHQSPRQGIYQRAGKVNGKTSWILSVSGALDHVGALWYNPGPDHWMIGSVDNVGTVLGGVASSGGGSSCPYNVPNNAWQYVDNIGGWINAGVNDVSIECLTGNHSFWQLRSLFQHKTKMRL